jgi:hypothetical protein
MPKIGPWAQDHAPQAEVMYITPNGSAPYFIEFFGIFEWPVSDSPCAEDFSRDVITVLPSGTDF